MTFDTAVELLNERVNISFPGTKIHVFGTEEETGKHLLVHISMWTSDVRRTDSDDLDFNITDTFHLSMETLESMNPFNLLEMIRLRLSYMFLHELDERIFLDNKKIFNPHLHEQEYKKEQK